MASRPAFAPDHHVHRLHAEDRDVLRPTWSRISILAPSNVPMVSAPSVRASCCRCRRPPCRGRDLFGQIGRRMITSARLTIVVRQEHDLEAPPVEASLLTISATSLISLI